MNGQNLLALADSDPEQFRKLMESVKDKVVHPHAAQRKVLDSQARFKVMNAGRRTGKTVLAAKIILQRCRQPNQVTWWVAPTYKVVKRGYAEILRQLPNGVLTHIPAPATNFDAGRSVSLRFKNGSIIELYSAERPEGMLGEGVDFAVLDESAIMPARIWEQVVRPTLMDRGGGALMISTPRGRNWFYQAWRRGQDSQMDAWESWTFPTASNPFIAAEEIAEMEATLPRITFQQEVLADFIADGSSVFILNDKAIQPHEILKDHFINGIKPVGHIVLGIDLARTTDYTVIYGARMADRRNCYFERMNSVKWSEQKRRIRRAVASCEAAGATGVTLCMDSTGVGDPIVEELEESGYDVIGINFTTHKNNMVRLLAKDLETAKAFVLSDAEIHEFENYAMSFTPSRKMSYSAPTGEHDDVVAAKMLQHHAIVNEGVPGLTIIGLDEADASANDPDAVRDEDFSENDFDDLIDEGEIVGTPDIQTLLVNRPSPLDLMNNPDLWG